MPLTRRHFLGMATALAVSSSRLSAEEAKDGFTILRARKASLGLLEDGAGQIDAWIFGDGPMPAVMRAKQGEEFRLRIVNELDAEIWLHFFGVRGPSELMTINVPPGADKAVDCVFTPPDAGTFWIGPVSDVSRHRDMGLTAMFIVEEAASLSGIVELPLVIDDWMLTDGGAITDGFGDVEAMVGEGRLGNWFTVNNRFRPKLPLQRGAFTRFRILNAANVRSMGLLFKGHDPLLVALDGQPVKPRQLGAKALQLAPGQRADLIASAEESDIILALDLFEDVVEIAYFNRAGEATAAVIDDNVALPPNPVAIPSVTAETVTLPIIIEGGIKGGLRSAIFRGQSMDIRTLLENGKGWALNGVAGPAAEPLFVAQKGQTLVLEFDNRTAFAQAMHIHGHVWQLPSGEGEMAAFSDTAVVPAGQQRRLPLVADNTGTWAIQSLVAERADGGMIGAFEVRDVPL